MAVDLAGVIGEMKKARKERQRKKNKTLQISSFLIYFLWGAQHKKRWSCFPRCFSPPRIGAVDVSNKSTKH